MKRPRWLVVCLLGFAGAFVLVGVGYWWVRWPDYTARTFIALLRESKYKEASQIIDLPTRARSPLDGLDYDRAVLRTDEFQSQPAGIAGMLEGRKRYSSPNATFTVERGRVSAFRWDERAPRIEIGIQRMAR